MTDRKENMKDYKNFHNTGEVKFRNNKCSIKGYGLYTNGNFTIKWVAYVAGLKHNLINVSQLVVVIRKQVTFDEDISVVSNNFVNCFC